MSIYNQSIAEESNVQISSPEFVKNEISEIDDQEPVLTERVNRTISPYVDELIQSHTEESPVMLEPLEKIPAYADLNHAEKV